MQIRLRSGLSLGYRTRGSGPVVVMLHPIGLDGSFWEPIVNRIESDFRVLSFDLRGHGASDVPAEDFRLSDLADEIAEAMRVLAGPDPCIVAGCSLGGMVAQALAFRHPDRIRALLLSNTIHALPEQGREMMRQRAVASRRGMPGVVDVMLDRWFSEAFRISTPEVIDEVRARLLRADPIVHAWGWEAISELDHSERLASVSIPALVGTGGLDESTPPAAAKAIAEAMPLAAYREAEGAGHMTPLEQPATVAGWIQELAKL